MPDLEAASRRAAELTARAAREALAARGRFALALSGGSTPARYFELLADADLPWRSVHVFFVDERIVPPDSMDSNYRLARERLLSRAPIPEANVRPMRSAAWPGCETMDRESAARAYEALLEGFFGAGRPPRFDVIHLGLGGDGHTASLFPGQSALAEASRPVLPVDYAGARPPVPRLTLTLPVLNAARLAFFLASGADKAALAEEILSGGGEAYPASRVRPSGLLAWIVAGT
jgi:6-phosphogluconolactonase